MCAFVKRIVFRRWGGSVSSLALLILLAALLWEAGCFHLREHVKALAPELTLRGPAGGAVEQVEVGSNVQLGLSGLRPSTMYSIVLSSEDGQLVSWARLTSDKRGGISPFVLWYQTGVVGCGPGVERLKGPFWFRSFEQARESLAGAALRLELQDLKGRVIASRDVPVATKPRAPTLYAGNRNGCLLNSVIERKQDMYAVGKNFPAGSIVEIYLVPARYRWRQGDPLRDIRGPNRTRSPLKLRLAEDQTEFVALLWKADETWVGSYDLVARHYFEGEDHIEWDFLGAGDVVTHPTSSGFVVQQVWGQDPHLSEDISGRRIFRSPWFEHVDGFVRGQDIWGAIDPKKKSSSNPYTYAAWYVVDHKSSWSDGDTLVDVTGGAEVTPIQPGCINHTWTKLWENPNPPGLGPASPTKAYDVVIDFGNFTPGSTVTATGSYTVDVDFIDRAEMEGFFIIDDPTAPGPFSSVGTADLDEGCDYELNKSVEWTNDFVTSPVSIALLDPIHTSGREPCNNSTSPTYDPINTARIIARIMYPQDAATGDVASGGPFPLVLFLHGQASFYLDSWLGYDYLLELLASHGFIAMSIDSRDFLDSNHIARGELVREFLRRMRDYNAAGGASIDGVSFVGKIDLSKVVIAGHSKGGEAVVAAYDLQRTNPDPGYTIKGIISIAPVQAIGHWGGTDPDIIIRLKDVPYLILHGAKDGDVSTFEGMRIYDRAGPFEYPGNTPRQMVFISHANHDFFNTEWITDDGESECPCDRVPDPLDPDQQQAAAKIFIHAFVQAYIHGKAEYLNYFTGVIPPSVSPPIEVVTSFHPGAPDQLTIDHHEWTDQAARDPSKNTLNGAVTHVSLDLAAAGAYPGINFDQYQLRASVPVTSLRISSDPGYVNDATTTINTSFPHSTHGTVFGWNSSGDSYSTEIPAACTVDGTSYPDCRALVPNYTHLSFRVGQVYRENDNQNPAGLPQDFSVRVTDSDGDSCPRIRVSSYTSLPYPYEAEYTSGSGGPKSVMRTVRIPLAAFTVNSSQVNLDKLQTITFHFDRTAKGEIALDGIEFVK